MCIVHATRMHRYIKQRVIHDICVSPGRQVARCRDEKWKPGKNEEELHDISPELLSRAYYNNYSLM